MHKATNAIITSNMTPIIILGGQDLPSSADLGPQNSMALLLTRSLSLTHVH